MATGDKLVNLDSLKTAYDTSAKFTAPMEASSTASAAHAAGEHFIYNGILYVATTDIASGATITPNTNCRAVPGGIGGEVSDLKSAIDNVKDDYISYEINQEKSYSDIIKSDAKRISQLESAQKSTERAVQNDSLRIDDLVSGLTQTKSKILVNRLGTAYLVNSTGLVFARDVYTLSDDIADEIVLRTDEAAILREGSASQVYSANSRKISQLEPAQKSTERTAQNNSLRIDDLINDLTKYVSGMFVDGSGSSLADGYGRLFARNMYAISDSVMDEIIDAVNSTGYLGVYDKLSFDDWIIPVLRMEGVIPALLTKTANKSIEQSVSAGDPPILYTFMGRSGVIDKMKVQGSSSVKFPKKNYTLTFHDSMVMADGWERSKKYVVKSNFNDCSQARNVCCAKLWGDIAKTRSAEQRNDLLIDGNGDYLANSAGAYLLGTALPPFNIGGNYGAIDGFPAIIVINGQYWGLYAFNVPKDKYMASMDGDGTECIVSCGGYSTTNAEYFKGQATMEPDANDVTDFEVEYSHNISDADILTSINQAISAAMATYSTDQEALEAINQYVDTNSAMDYFILTALINNTDGVGKNYLLDTWDGVKWYFVPYDMDMVLGNDKWAGTKVGAPNDGLTFASLSSMHRLFYAVYHYDKANFINRYKALRAGALSEANVYRVFGTYINQIPNSAYAHEGIRWPGTPGTSVKTFDQIVNWYRLRCMYLDKEIEQLEAAI